MNEFEKLALQREKIRVLIDEALDLKKQILDILVEARKELSDMTQLIKHYPHSEKIPTRIKACDDVLAKSTVLLSQIESQLPDYKARIQHIDEMILRGGDTSSSHTVVKK